MKHRCVLKGFTLIELLVVIAVLALLLSVIMPSLVKAKELARRTVCLSHMSQLGLICQTYANENNDWFPDYNGWPASDGNPGGQSTDPRMIFDGYNADARPVWEGHVADYTIEWGTDLFYCPSDRMRTREKSWPADPHNPNSSYWTGYAYWGNFGNEAYYYPAATVWGSRIPPPRRTTTIKTSSAIVPLFGDWVFYSGNNVPTPWLATHTKYGRALGFVSENPMGMNSAYADGSARWCKYKGDESDEFSTIMQWNGITIRFWGVSRAFEREDYGLPEELPE